MTHTDKTKNQPVPQERQPKRHRLLINACSALAGLALTELLKQFLRRILRKFLDEE